jgi:calcineurin-like phosphoesterase family protein
MKKINIKTNEDLVVYFTSDLHLNHKGPRGSTPLWQSRGYTSPEDMTNGVINTLNGIVRPNDYLFHLGDHCLDTTEGEFESNLARINCQNIHMLWGNHNSRVKDVYDKAVKSYLGILYNENHELYPIRYKNIVFCGDYLEISVNGQLIVMCHYPMDIFNKMSHGTYMLCGHSHYGYKMTRSDCFENRRLDVGWDGHNKPLSFKEVNVIMNRKQFVSYDHHGKFV